MEFLNWRLSHRADARALSIADRHYNRQKPGTPQFVPPGRCLVLWQPKAFWVTSWPFAEYVKHAWAGAWVCSAFRNEGAGLSSDLIREAVAATRWKWPETPALGMVTFVNRDKVRAKRDPGRCFLRAGFENVGETAGGLVALLMLPDAMPAPERPEGEPMPLFETASRSPSSSVASRSCAVPAAADAPAASPCSSSPTAATATRSPRTTFRSVARTASA